MSNKEFPPFRLDLLNQCLWRQVGESSEQRLVLPPKAFALLSHLIAHAGRLVTHHELLETLWPNTDVQPEVLKSQLVEIRRALGDDPRAPTFIETLHRRGYRFIGALRSREDAPVNAGRTDFPFVGRRRALEQLCGNLQSAQAGRPQVVCVTGELGGGKTALADEFQRRTRSEIPGVQIARGQCIEGYGGKEAYYPLLQALGRLLEGPIADLTVQILASRAPTWLAQFPNLLTRQHRETLQRETSGETRNRMLREIVDALLAMTSHTSILIVFEDLQWADHATVDLISALARQRARARLMLLTTDRPVDLLLANHPFRALKCELIASELASQMILEPLGQEEVAEFLAPEPGDRALPAGLVAFLHGHTEGNPLFMVAAMQHLLQRKLICRQSDRWHLEQPLEQIDLGVPEGLRQLIEMQLEKLGELEQRALEAASVCGTVFPVAVGTALEGMDCERFEILCGRLEQRYQLVRTTTAAMFSGRTSIPHYRFAHALYRDVLYKRLGPERRTRLQRRIAHQLQSLYGQQQVENVSQRRPIQRESSALLD